MTYAAYLAQTKEDDLELLCEDGSRRPISEFRNCHWGLAPTDAILTTSAKSSSTRILYQNWLQVFLTQLNIINLFGIKDTCFDFNVLM